MSNTVKYEGIDKLKIKYRLRRTGLKTKIRDWLKRDVKETVFDAIRDRFQSESDGTSNWSPLAERTIRDRQAKGFGGRHPILVRTGELLREAFGQAKGNKSPVLKSSGNEMALAFSLASKKAFAHVSGKGKSGQGLPKRNFMILVNEEWRELSMQFHSLVYDLMRE